ncbi:MAG: hypothetical protein WDA20_05390 [Desulfuromonadales bacterium]
MGKLSVLLTVACLLAWPASDVLATGFGFYGTLGQGEIKYENDEVYSWAGDADGSSRDDTDLLGVGMVFDTAVARDRVFNYRLHLGYEKLKMDTDAQKDEFDRLEYVVIDQDFGFALYGSAYSRIWFGPELRIFFSHDEFGMGIGPVLGVNLHTGRKITTALKVGFLFSDFASDDFFSRDYERESHAFLNLAILFRSAGDRYERRE